MAQVGYQHVGLAELYLDQTLELKDTELFCMFSKFPFHEITIAIIVCRTVCPTMLHPNATPPHAAPPTLSYPFSQIHSHITHTVRYLHPGSASFRSIRSVPFRSFLLLVHFSCWYSGNLAEEN